MDSTPEGPPALAAVSCLLRLLPDLQMPRTKMRLRALAPGPHKPVVQTSAER